MNMKAKKHLGQHFLKSRRFARTLAESVCAPGALVLEIGPGKGVLTAELLKKARKVIAIEKDKELVGFLCDTFADDIAAGRLEVVSGDALEVSPPVGEYVLAANIPYYITGAIIRKYLSGGNPPRAAGLLVQKEVAERIVRKDGKESVISVVVRAYGRPRIVARVGAKEFSPAPKVDSAILAVSREESPFSSAREREEFFAFVKKGFSSKRKFLKSNLSGEDFPEGAEKAFARAGIPLRARAEEVLFPQWVSLYRALRRR